MSATEHMDVSPYFKATTLFAASPCAAHIASLSGARLQIRSLPTCDFVRSITLPSSHDVRNSRLAWSPAIASPSPSSPPRDRNATPPRHHRPSLPSPNRILVSDSETTRVYDLRDDRWSAVISNGSGGMGKNVHAEFGRTEDEVIIWNDFSSRTVVWCLRTGRSVEIRDPKFGGRDGKGWGYRPKVTTKEGGVEKQERGVLALLCRSAGQDILMLFAPGSYKVFRRIELATQDAQGVKWSRDGRWLVVWDAASVGYNLRIYTADGHLYRVIEGESTDEASEWAIEGLGIKTVEWIPGNEWLAIGGWDRRVRILSTKTFAPVVFLDHTAQICVPETPVFSETIDGNGARSYTITPQPATPPKAPPEKNDTGVLKQGIGIMAFNKDGTLCATRDDSTPSTVWVWDLCSLKPRAIFIQHSPIKSLQWHPKHASHLLIQTTHDSPTLYLYTANALSSSTCSAGVESAPPSVLDLSKSIAKPAGSAAARWTCRWLDADQDKKPALVFGHQQGFAAVWPEGKDAVSEVGAQDASEESDDSLYDILTGKTPVPPLHGSHSVDSMEEDEYVDVDADGIDVDMEEQSDGESTEVLDDTFREMRRGVTTRERGRSVLNDSGLDEMF